MLFHIDQLRHQQLHLNTEPHLARWVNHCAIKPVHLPLYSNMDHYMPIHTVQSGFLGEPSMCGQHWAENTSPQEPCSANTNNNQLHTIVRDIPVVSCMYRYIHSVNCSQHYRHCVCIVCMNVPLVALCNTMLS